MNSAKTLLLTSLLLLTKLSYAQLPANFTWINIESDQKVMPLVRRALHDPKITAIREVGVEDGYALVMTASRESDAPTPDYDEWIIYNVVLNSGKSRILAGGYGVKIAGCTVHLVDEQLDHGVIILQKTVPVLEEDDAHALAERILEQEHIAYAEAIACVLSEKYHVVGRRYLPKSEN